MQSSFGMVLDPVQRRLAKFPCGRSEHRGVLNSVQALPSESLRQLAPRQMQRTHAVSPALPAKKPGLPRRVESFGVAKHLSTLRTAFEPGQPATEANSPESEIAERQSPIARAFDLASGQQDQPEHRFGNFMLWQNLLGDLAHDGQTNAQFVVALRFVKRLNQLALLDTHQVAGFLLDVPNLHVRENFERGAVTVFDSPGAARNTPNTARRSPHETD